MDTLEKHRITLIESRPKFIKEEESIDDTDELLEMDISKTDLDRAIKSMKNGKSSGPVWVELIKYDGDRLKERIQNLIGRVVGCYKTPKEQKISHIFSICKKGDRRAPKDYREESVNGILRRLFSRI